MASVSPSPAPVAPRDPSRPAVVRPRCPKYQTLDAWRGVACLFVVLLHSVSFAADNLGHDPASWIVWLFDQLSIGVPMFFVISGYCISATADSSRLRGSSLSSVGTYFRRRFRRIYPPYWAFLLLTALFVSLLGPALFSDERNRILSPGEVTPAQWIGNLTLTETWLYHIAGGSKALIAGHLWTLCYEEQFYLITGLILLLAPQRYFLAATLITAGVAAARVAAKVFGWSLDGLFLDGRWGLFALGIAVYYRVNYGGLWFRRLLNLALAGTFLALVLSPAHPNNKLEYGSGLAFALILSLGHACDRTTAAWPAIRPLHWCGTMCYSLYLVHWPLTLAVSHSLYLQGISGPLVTLLVTVPLCLLVSLPVSWAFHCQIERRFLNSPQLSPSPR